MVVMYTRLMMYKSWVVGRGDRGQQYPGPWGGAEYEWVLRAVEEGVRKKDG